MDAPASATTVLLSEFCCENTVVIFVFPNCKSAFTPNRLCAPVIKEFLIGIEILPASKPCKMSSSLGSKPIFTKF